MTAISVGYSIHETGVTTIRPELIVVRKHDVSPLDNSPVL